MRSTEIIRSPAPLPVQSARAGRKNRRTGGRTDGRTDARAAGRSEWRRRSPPPPQETHADEGAEFCQGRRRRAQRQHQPVEVAVPRVEHEVGQRHRGRRVARDRCRRRTPLLRRLATALDRQSSAAHLVPASHMGTSVIRCGCDVYSRYQ